MNVYIFFVRIIAFFMLFSTASRTCITSLAGYFLTYFMLYIYSKNSLTANALLIITMLLLAFIIMLAVDWYFILAQSGRLGNFAALLNMTPDEWITGFGFTDYQTPASFRAIGERLGFGYMDSMYAMLLLRSGIVGFCLFVVPLIVGVVKFFRGMKHLTQLQRAVGALLVQTLYYFLFEKTLYEFSYAGLIIFTFYIAVANEKANSHTAHLKPLSHQRRKPALHAERLQASMLHNS